MKMKYFAIIACLTAALLMSACRGSETPDTSPAQTETQAETEAAKQVSLYDLSKAVLASGEFAKTLHASNNDDGAEQTFAKVSDFDYEKIEAFYIDAAENGAESADEIVVIRARDAADVPALRASLEKHLEARKALYKTYGADLLPVLDKAVITTEGEFAALFICGDPNAAKAAFLEFIGK